jgi:choline dehydrogenase-like flavoprotein
MPRNQTSDARVVVIGTGPAGSAAAVFLSRAGIDVLVLEAGSARAGLGLTVRVGGMTVLKYRRPLRRRERVSATADENAVLYEDLSPGGLTNHWSCAVPRFSTSDFADAARAGEAFTWPIGYQDLAPWYGRVETLLHVAGARDDSPQLPAGNVRHARRLGPDWAEAIQGARETGRSLMPMPYAYGADTTVTPSGTVFNSYVRLIRPEQRLGRITVRFDARVLRLEWSPVQRRVNAVILRDARTGAEDRVLCRAVVLAAGAINTAQILLASTTADFPHGLGNAHGVLGRYLHDHPTAKLVIDVATPKSIRPASYFTRPALDRAPPLYAAACMQWCNTPTLARSVLGGHPGRVASIGFTVFGTQPPAEENYVSIDRSCQRPSEAALTLNIRHPRESQQALTAARDDLIELLESVRWNPKMTTWYVAPVGDSKHYGGTCRMHTSPRFGMLDGWSRMHAVRNVLVADSAAFTTGPEKNPVLTAMALAARASHRLAEDLRQGNV